MALKDHYLAQDYPMMADQLDILHKTTMQILNSVTHANFNHNEQYLSEINNALKILMALNAKKVERDRVNDESVIRRNWF